MSDGISSAKKENAVYVKRPTFFYLVHVKLVLNRGAQFRVQFRHCTYVFNNEIKNSVFVRTRF